ncbi:MAG: rhodanese-like domain-containing protein [Pseudomonadota bacterium]
MSLFITPTDLLPLIGTPAAPRLIDVRLPEDAAADPMLIPGAVRATHTDLEAAQRLAGPDTVILCQRGAKLSQGVAAALRSRGIPVRALAGGTEAWAALPGAPRLAISKVPDGPICVRLGTIDGLAAAWAIRRFAAPCAEIWDVEAPGEVAARFGGTAIEHGAIAEIGALGLNVPALDTLARALEAGTPSLADLWAGLYDTSAQAMDRGCALMDAALIWARSRDAGGAA